MNKPRKHAELIKAWADGAKIQEKVISTIDDAYGWVDQALPRWIPEFEYRVKPREFEDGAWYPIIVAKTQYVARYLEYNRGFKIGDSSIAVKLDQIEWIGEKLDIDWESE